MRYGGGIFDFMSEKYSDIINLPDLITERKSRFESIFLVDRESLYANN